jgi:aspartate beta-hydroxylase
LTDVSSLTAEGFAALKRGDAAAARDLFGRLVSAGTADAAVWFGASVAYRRLDSPAEESGALEQALKLDPHYLPALIGMGDLHVRQGDERAAGSFYAAARRVAASLKPLPAEWLDELRRIEAASQRIASNFEARLRSVLAAHGCGSPGTERFGRAIDLLLGKRQIYLQQPKNFYFPELPQIEFYDRKDFPWAKTLEAETSRIRAELRAILEAGAAFVPYIQREARQPVLNPNPLMDSPNWGAFYLIRNGKEVAENAARCPGTMAALQQVPLCRVHDRTPSVLFSLLRPGTRIRPHHGFMNARLICHLPLIIPSDCGLRVGNEIRGWREGELLVFDDSVEHEAWNLSSELRVVLIFDIWRPELSEKERILAAAMLEAVDRFGGSRTEWTE